MTAEIAVMNRVAIALAADSAGTSFHGSVAKIYQTADKLFNLDAESPVAIMIHGGSEFLSIPWETVVKLFRARHSKKRATVKEYGEAFLRFLSADELVSDELVDGYFHQTIYAVLDSVLRRARKHADETGAQMAASLKSIVDEFLQDWISRPFFGDMNETTVEVLQNRYAGWLDEVCKQMVQTQFEIDEATLSVMRVSKRFDAGVSKPHQESALRIALGAKKLIAW